MLKTVNHKAQIDHRALALRV